MFCRIAEQRSLWAKTAVASPLPVSVFVLEQTDQQCEPGIDTLACIIGFLLSCVGGTFALASFRVSLNLHGALALFQHHGESEHDGESREPSRVFARGGLESRLLPFQDVCEDLFAQDVEKELELSVGETG